MSLEVLAHSRPSVKSCHLSEEVPFSSLRRHNGVARPAQWRSSWNGFEGRWKYKAGQALVLGALPVGLKHAAGKAGRPLAILPQEALGQGTCIIVLREGPPLGVSQEVGWRADWKEGSKAVRNCLKLPWGEMVRTQKR